MNAIPSEGRAATRTQSKSGPRCAKPQIHIIESNISKPVMTLKFKPKRASGSFLARRWSTGSFRQDTILRFITCYRRTRVSQTCALSTRPWLHFGRALDMRTLRQIDDTILHSGFQQVLILTRNRSPTPPIPPSASTLNSHADIFNGQPSR